MKPHVLAALLATVLATVLVTLLAAYPPRAFQLIHNKSVQQRLQACA